MAIYTDPDFYPPTINAIINLAAHCSEVVVISRNNSRFNFPFPENVWLRKSGKLLSVADAEKRGSWYKLLSFLRFAIKLYSNAANKETDLLILYDPFPLLAFSIIRKFLPRRIITWYHNHDMPDVTLNRKLTIGWYAAAKEHAAMQHIRFFSLPSKDRLQFYPNWEKTADHFIIPNYPSLKVYDQLPKQVKDNGDIRIIFQGAIGEGHALEELILLLGEKIGGRSLQLVLKGPVRELYRQKLDQLAIKNNVQSRVTWIGIGPYKEVPVITSSCQIGIAIHMGKDNVSRTLGTASNKIYEYAACGLPVVLYDDIPFTSYLKDRQWTFFTDGSIDGLRNTIVNVITRITEAGESAINDFHESLNFEKAFLPALNSVIKTSGKE